ncbi:MAG TPA: hypothetical protein VMB34_09320 [Acetobacteraceae bacterium]|nr:hypothetical protein [Acetobacteraceae bacterium]
MLRHTMRCHACLGSGNGLWLPHGCRLGRRPDAAKQRQWHRCGESRVLRDDGASQDVGGGAVKIDKMARWRVGLRREYSQAAHTCLCTAIIHRKGIIHLPGLAAATMGVRLPDLRLSFSLTISLYLL